MHVLSAAYVLAVAQLAAAIPNIRPDVNTIAAIVGLGSTSTKDSTTSTTSQGSSSVRTRPSAQTYIPVAAADTVRDIVDLGITPALLRVDIKPNPDFSPNVTQALVAAEAKYVVIEEQFQLEKRAEEERMEAERLEARGIAVRARPVVKTLRIRPTVATAKPAIVSTTPVIFSTSPAAIASPLAFSTSISIPAVASVVPIVVPSSTVKVIPTLMTAAKNIQLDSEFLSDIYIGSNGDKVSVVMDTGSADLWMFSTDCVGCSGTHNYYNPSKSSTFKNTTTPFKLLYGDGSQTSGILAFDTVNLAGAPIQAQSIDVAHTISPNLQSNAMDGILGLGFPNLMSVQGQTGVSTPVTNMMSQGLIPAGMFGLQYIKTNLWSYLGGGGAWTFGGYDSSVISGLINSVPLTRAQYWMISMDQVSVGSAYSYKPTQNVIVDSGTTLILLDPVSVNNIHKYLPGGRVSPDNSHYQIFCNASNAAYAGSRNAFFTLNGVKYGVPARDLAWYPEAATPGYCYSGIQPWSNSFGILGVMFLKNVYAIFDQTNQRMQFAGRTDIAALLD